MLVDEETVIQKVKQALRDSFQGDDQVISDQTRTRDHDDDNRPSRRRRVGQEGDWTSGASAEAANPMFQQLATDALREYQEGRAEVSHTLQGRHGPEGNQQQPQLPVPPSTSHIQGQEDPDSGFESRLVGSPNFDLLRAAAHPQERHESTEVQQRQQQYQTFPPEKMQVQGQDDADSKPAAS